MFLAQQLADTPAPAVVSYYDCPRVHDLYPEDRWQYDRVEATANSSTNRWGKGKKKVQELILTKKGEFGGRKDPVDM